MERLVSVPLARRDVSLREKSAERGGAEDEKDCSKRHVHEAAVVPAVKIFRDFSGGRVGDAMLHGASSLHALRARLKGARHESRLFTDMIASGLVVKQLSLFKRSEPQRLRASDLAPAHSASIIFGIIRGC